MGSQQQQFMNNQQQLLDVNDSKGTPKSEQGGIMIGQGNHITQMQSQQQQQQDQQLKYTFVGKEMTPQSSEREEYMLQKIDNEALTSYLMLTTPTKENLGGTNERLSFNLSQTIGLTGEGQTLSSIKKRSAPETSTTNDQRIAIQSTNINNNNNKITSQIDDSQPNTPRTLPDTRRAGSGSGGAISESNGKQQQIQAYQATVMSAADKAQMVESISYGLDLLVQSQHRQALEKIFEVINVCENYYIDHNNKKIFLLVESIAKLVREIIRLEEITERFITYKSDSGMLQAKKKWDSSFNVQKKALVNRITDMIKSKKSIDKVKFLNLQNEIIDFQLIISKMTESTLQWMNQRLEEINKNFNVIRDEKPALYRYTKYIFWTLFNYFGLLREFNNANFFDENDLNGDNLTQQQQPQIIQSSAEFKLKTISILKSLSITGSRIIPVVPFNEIGIETLEYLINYFNVERVEQLIKDDTSAQECAFSKFEAKKNYLVRRFIDLSLSREEFAIDISKGIYDLLYIKKFQQGQGLEKTKYLYDQMKEKIASCIDQMHVQVKTTFFKEGQQQSQEKEVSSSSKKSAQKNSASKSDNHEGNGPDLASPMLAMADAIIIISYFLNAEDLSKSSGNIQSISLDQNIKSALITEDFLKKFKKVVDQVTPTFKWKSEALNQSELADTDREHRRRKSSTSKIPVTINERSPKTNIANLQEEGSRSNIEKFVQRQKSDQQSLQSSSLIIEKGSNGSKSTKKGLAHSMHEHSQSNPLIKSNQNHLQIKNLKRAAIPGSGSSLLNNQQKLSMSSIPFSAQQSFSNDILIDESTLAHLKKMSFMSNKHQFNNNNNNLSLISPTSASGFPSNILYSASPSHQQQQQKVIQNSFLASPQNQNKISLALDRIQENISRLVSPRLVDVNESIEPLSADRKQKSQSHLSPRVVHSHREQQQQQNIIIEDPKREEDTSVLGNSKRTVQGGGGMNSNDGINYSSSISNKENHQNGSKFLGRANSGTKQKPPLPANNTSKDNIGDMCSSTLSSFDVDVAEEANTRLQESNQKVLNDMNNDNSDRNRDSISQNLPKQDYVQSNHMAMVSPKSASGYFGSQNPSKNLLSHFISPKAYKNAQFVNNAAAVTPGNNNHIQAQNAQNTQNKLDSMLQQNGSTADKSNETNMLINNKRSDSILKEGQSEQLSYLNSQQTSENQESSMAFNRPSMMKKLEADLQSIENSSERNSQNEVISPPRQSQFKQQPSPKSMISPQNKQNGLALNLQSASNQGGVANQNKKIIKNRKSEDVIEEEEENFSQVMPNDSGISHKSNPQQGKKQFSHRSGSIHASSARKYFETSQEENSLYRTAQKITTNQNTNEDIATEGRANTSQSDIKARDQMMNGSASFEFNKSRELNNQGENYSPNKEILKLPSSKDGGKNILAELNSNSDRKATRDHLLQRGTPPKNNNQFPVIEEQLQLERITSGPQSPSFELKIQSPSKYQDTSNGSPLAHNQIGFMLDKDQNREQSQEKKVIQVRKSSSNSNPDNNGNNCQTFGTKRANESFHQQENLYQDEQTVTKEPQVENIQNDSITMQKTDVSQGNKKQSKDKPKQSKACCSIF